MLYNYVVLFCIVHQQDHNYMNMVFEALAMFSLLQRGLTKGIYSIQIPACSILCSSELITNTTFQFIFN